MTHPKALSAPTVVIEPTTGWRSLGLREIWAFRDLIYIFAWRDLKVRYRQTLLGALWVMGQPLVTMLIFTLLFNRVARLQTGSSTPYPLFVLAGILIWTFVAGAIMRAGNSLIGASYLISKVYLPRLIIPLSNVVIDAVDLAVGAILLVPMMLWFGIAPGIGILLAPVVVALAGILALGAGLWIAALNVEYRDVRIVIPWLLQIAMFVTPVAYPLSAIPQRYRWIAGLNPAAAIVESFRAALFGTSVAPLSLLWSAAAGVGLLLSGALYFRRVERRFADIL